MCISPESSQKSAEFGGTFRLPSNYPKSWHIFGKKNLVKKNVIARKMWHSKRRLRLNQLPAKRSSHPVLLYFTSFKNLGNSAQQSWLSLYNTIMYVLSIV